VQGWEVRLPPFREFMSNKMMETRGPKVLSRQLETLHFGFEPCGGKGNKNFKHKGLMNMRNQNSTNVVNL
jgi:hypothetical protein